MKTKKIVIGICMFVIFLQICIFVKNRILVHQRSVQMENFLYKNSDKRVIELMLEFDKEAMKPNSDAEKRKSILYSVLKLDPNYNIAKIYLSNELIDSDIETSKKLLVEVANSNGENSKLALEKLNGLSLRR